MDKRQESDRPQKKPPYYYLGWGGIALMAISAASQDLGIILIALVYSTGVSAYMLSEGIETRRPKQAAGSIIAIIATCCGILLILAIAAVELWAVIIPVSETALAMIASALQAMVAWVCLVTGL